MILVDTSAWIEYDRATGSPTDERLTQAITAGEPIAVTEPVLMEVLAGAVDEQSTIQLRRLLTSFSWIAVEASTDFEGAATVYRSCRSVGVTPRGLIDCMIASIAMRTGASVLTADRDFASIADVVPLTLVPTATG